MRALLHLMYADHPLKPATCAGCCEVAGFAVIEGYQGDTEYPICPELGAAYALRQEGQHASL